MYPGVLVSRCRGVLVSCVQCPRLACSMAVSLYVHIYIYIYIIPAQLAEVFTDPLGPGACADSHARITNACLVWSGWALESTRSSARPRAPVRGGASPRTPGGQTSRPAGFESPRSSCGLCQTQPRFSGSLLRAVSSWPPRGSLSSSLTAPRFFVYFFAGSGWCQTVAKMQAHCHCSIIIHHQENVHINIFTLYMYDSRLWHLAS